MWKTAGNDCSDAANLRVLTLCTVKGARFRASEKNPGMTKIVTLTFAFLFCKYCIVTIEAVLSATSDSHKSFL